MVQPRASVFRGSQRTTRRASCPRACRARRRRQRRRNAGIESAEVGDRIRYTVVAPPRTTRTESAHTRAQTSRHVNHPAYGRRRSADGRVRGVWHTATDRAEIMTTPRETRTRNTRPCAGPAGARAGGGCDCACRSRVAPSDDDDDETLGRRRCQPTVEIFKPSNLS